METTYEQRLNGSNDFSFAASYHADGLDSVSGEPLEGSGFEEEKPESDFEEEQ